MEQKHKDWHLQVSLSSCSLLMFIQSYCEKKIPFEGLLLEKYPSDTNEELLCTNLLSVIILLVTVTVTVTVRVTVRVTVTVRVRARVT